MNRFTLHIFVFSVLLFSFRTKTKADIYKVTIRVNVYDQSEFTGYNFVTEFASLVYGELQDGNIVMYDTYLKENLLDFKAINALEKSSGTTFLHVQNLFIYEYWKVGKYKTKIHPVGFVFTTRSKEDQDVSYGYLDYSDIKQIMERKLKTNVNGPMNISFNDALLAKKYHFDLIQVNNEMITNGERSEFIMQSAFKGKYQPNISIDTRRLVLYKVTDQCKQGEKQPLETLLLNQISRFLRNDTTLILTYCDSLKKNPELFKNFRVNEILIAEIIDHNRKFIRSEPLSIILNFNGIYFDPISFDTFKRWPILVNFRSASDIIKEKSFDYTIFRINSQELKPDDSPYYISAIKTLKWNELSILVREMKGKAAVNRN